MSEIETEITALLEMGAGMIDSKSVQKLLLKFRITELNLELEKLNHQTTLEKLNSLKAELEFAYDE
jgi:hypothetical protein